jgi:hypothetical protein
LACCPASASSRITMDGNDQRKEARNKILESLSIRR